MTAPTGSEQATPDPGGGLPSDVLFSAVIGQPGVVSHLRAAARRPVHAYLFVGPPGAGAPEAARGFAAAVLCRNGGCGECDVCRRALEGVHPDLVEIERTGAALSVADAHQIVTFAQRRPLEGHRQVIVVSDLHSARLAAPVLLKTLEEPPGPTVFVLLAEVLPAELSTVASRCARIDFGPVAQDEIATWLEGNGLPAETAADLAAASGGSVARARLLAEDPEYARRRERWRSVPVRLDGTGASAAMLAGEILAAADSALEPLRNRHEEELAELAARAEALGDHGVPGRKRVEERQQREERRLRTDEIRAGLGVLAGAYRDRLASEASSGSRAADRARALVTAVETVDSAAAELVRNPNEPLMLEALFVRLSAVPA